MKVTRDTPDHLILEDVPVALGIGLFLFLMAFILPGGLLMFFGEWVIGLFFVVFGGGLGLLAIVVFVQRRQVILDRAAGTLTIRSASILHRDQQVHPLSEVSGAEVRISPGGQSLFAAIIIPDGEAKGVYPLGASSAKGPDPATVAQTINRWLGAADDRRDTVRSRERSQ
jgi:hypothetical protein